MTKLVSLIIGLLLTATLGFPQTLKHATVGGQTVIRRAQSGGGGGGSDFVTANFTASSDIGLKDYTPGGGEVGADFTDHPHANYNSSALTVDAATDRVYGTGTDAQYASGIPPSADYYVQADVTAVTIISVNIAVTGRMDTTADTMYLCRENSGTSYDLRKIVAGTASTLATNSSAQPTAGQTVNIKLIMTGDQISCVANGVTLGPVTDTSITATGRAGIRSSGASSATTGMHVDNFSAR